MNVFLSTFEDAASRPAASVPVAVRAATDGLTESDVQERLQTVGRNVVAHERATPWPLMLLHNARNPFILVLVVLGAVSYATGDLKGAPTTVYVFQKGLPVPYAP